MRPGFEFQQLGQFVAIARAKNFTRAAQHLNLTQPTLSRAIRRLEDQLGEPLFERKPRELVLTDLGELLLERAKEILNLVEDTCSLLADAGRRGRVRLGAIPTVAPYFLPGFLTGFAGSHPNVSVVVREDTTDNLIKRCKHGEIDLAILALPVLAKQLEVEPLFEEELLLVLPAGHPLDSPGEIAPEVVEDFPFVMLNEAHCLSENIASFCRQQSLRPVTVERISQLATVQELVALGHGVSFVPELARRLDTSGRRVYRSFGHSKPTRTVAMMWNRGRYQSESVLALMDGLRSYSRTVLER